MKKSLTEDQIETMITENPHKGFDTCATCDSVYEYGTMKETSQESFDLICDDCVESKKIFLEFK